jgi:L-malate glycosyltransferase
MKLMAVGHAFVLAYAQKKFVAMRELLPSLQFRLVIPDSIDDRFRKQTFEIHPQLGREEVVALAPHLAGIQQHMTYVHNPVQIARVVREFAPDVIHIDEEPQALLTVETIALQRAISPQSSVTLFTWDNLLRSRKFPIGTTKAALRRYSLARTSTVICGNDRAAELVHGERYFHGNIEILPQFGLDPAEHQPGNESDLRRSLGLENAVVVGHAGRLVPEKGVLLLLEALSRVTLIPWKCLLLGGGSLEREIREKWIPKFPGRIVLLPPVPYEQVSKYLRCMDIFVLASYTTPTWAEQFGLSLAQALLLGIPAIGSTSGAIPRVLGPGGMTFEERRVDDLTRALESMLSSPARRREFGVLGREFALKHYTTERVAAGYLTAFENSRRSKPNPARAVRDSVAEPKA